MSRKSTTRPVAQDAYSNIPARIGDGSPSLGETGGWTMERWTLNYYLMLTLSRNHWIARKIVHAPAQDMTKAWARLNCESLKPQEIAKFDRVISQTATPAKVRHSLELGRLFGGAGGLIVIKGHENQLDQPLDWETVSLDSYMGMIPFDRWSGITPSMEVCTDINRPLDYGLPEFYTITPQDMAEYTGGHETKGSAEILGGGGVGSLGMGRVHCSRILRFCGPSVPNPEFQANLRWGISVLEPCMDELRAWDSAVSSVTNLMYRANILAQVNPMLAQKQAAAGGAAIQAFQQEMQNQNWLLSNQSMLLLPKDGSMQNYQYSFGGVAEVLSAAASRVAGAANMPIIKLFGRLAGGLGDTGESEMRVYEDNISRMQHDELYPQLMKLYPVVAMSVFGQVPDDLDVMFPSIRSLTEKEKAELAKEGCDAILAPFNAGTYGQKTVLTALRGLNEYTGLFPITDEQIADATDDVPLPIEIEQEEARAGTEEFAEGKGGAKAEKIGNAGDAEFVESEHPRNSGGQFGSGLLPGTGSKSKMSKAEKAESEKSARRAERRGILKELEQLKSEKGSKARAREWHLRSELREYEAD